MTLNLPSDASYVPLVRALSATMMKQMEVVGEDIDDASLVLGEVCANVVRHAHSNPQTRYVVEIDYFAEHILVTVTDNGKGFDRSKVPPPTLEKPGGRGLWLIENLADRVEFQPVAEGGTSVRAQLKIRYSCDEAQEKAEQMDQRSLEDCPGIVLSADIGTGSSPAHSASGE